MSGPRLPVHFSPVIAARIRPDFWWWADAIRSWHYQGDPDRIFGRDVGNHPDGYTATWARHMHMVPSPDQPGHAKWENARSTIQRTSDRLLVYSMDPVHPLKYGVLLLALLGDPGGHDRLVKGATAQERRELWEDLAYAHQTDGDMPDGTITES